MVTKYKRVLLKISGEALLGNQQFGIDYEPVEMIANEIKSIYDKGVEVAVVVGGGNILVQNSVWIKPPEIMSECSLQL